MVAPESPTLRACLEQAGVAYRTRVVPHQATMCGGKLEAIQRWHEHDWRRIEPKSARRSSGHCRRASLFDDSPALKRVLSAQGVLRPVANADGGHGQPLPSMGDLIGDRHRVRAQFPMASNPGLARLIGTLLKQDFQRAVLAHPVGHQLRHAIGGRCSSCATSTTRSPPPAKRIRPATRSSSVCHGKGKRIAIVATQSLSSLKSALPGETWRTLLQTFRIEGIPRAQRRLQCEGGQRPVRARGNASCPNATWRRAGRMRASVCSPTRDAHRASISTSKSCGVQRDAVFESKVFTPNSRTPRPSCSLRRPESVAADMLLS